MSSPSDVQHVDLWHHGTGFVTRLPLDDPMLFNAMGGPSQLAEGSATYYSVSKPHTLAECERPLSVLDTLRERIGNLGGFQRTEQGGFWIDRADVLSILDEYEAEA